MGDGAAEAAPLLLWEHISKRIRQPWRRQHATSPII
jgi:hypothetical protein